MRRKRACIGRESNCADRDLEEEKECQGVGFLFPLFSTYLRPYAQPGTNGNHGPRVRLAAVWGEKSAREGALSVENAKEKSPKWCHAMTK